MDNLIVIFPPPPPPLPSVYPLSPRRRTPAPLFYIIFKYFPPCIIDISFFTCHYKILLGISLRHQPSSNPSKFPPIVHQSPAAQADEDPKFSGFSSKPSRIDSNKWRHFQKCIQFTFSPRYLNITIITKLGNFLS